MSATESRLAGLRPRRLAFLGTPEPAATVLRALVRAGYEIVAVVTRPDKRRGRGAELLPSPVKAAAAELGLGPLVAHRAEEVIGSGAELGVVVAYGRLVKPAVLAAVPMVNVHFSLLPRWRGAAPVERAILAGDTETGVCLMELEEGLDTGPVLGRREVAIGDDETAGELREALTAAGTDLLLTQLAAGLAPGCPQEGEATYAAKIDPGELHLDWTQPAVQLHRVVRVGRAWTTFRGRRLGIVRTASPWDEATGEAPGSLVISRNGVTVATGDGRLSLAEVQPEGRSAMAATAWVNGAHVAPGERFE
ncbi:MAG: methionyl-tRNA formyltransferase [Acidimicrobiales bacterium]